jgi:geranylgeranyl diphosphate synthase type II
VDAALEDRLEPKRRLVEDALDAALPAGPETPEVIANAMRYAVTSGGKRFRPVLCLAACEACGADETLALAPACAVEFVHAFSLVHDDLPAMDDDDLRRGRPTLHKVAGEAMAILAGDALLSLAFDVLVNDERLDAERKVDALRELAWASGHAALAAGQALDLQSEGQTIGPEALERMHEGKTAALITAAVVMGGIAAGGASAQVESLRRYGRHLGLAFQIIDDVLDVVGDEAKLGKHTGADAAHAKATAVAVHGLDGARALAAEHVEQAVAAVDLFGEHGALLAAIAQAMLTREH